MRGRPPEVGVLKHAWSLRGSGWDVKLIMCMDRVGGILMAQKHRNGETRTCPYCGQRSTFSERLRVPGVDAKPGTADGTSAAAVPEYKSGWACENKRCSRPYDFS